MCVCVCGSCGLGLCDPMCNDIYRSGKRAKGRKLTKPDFRVLTNKSECVCVHVCVCACMCVCVCVCVS